MSTARIRRDRARDSTYSWGAAFAACAALSFHALHPRQVLARERIYERVWGWLGGSQRGGRLRARLREKLSPELIVTVWGVGYRFDPPVT